MNDSYVVTLNGETAKLFRSGSLTLRDILLMNGYTYADMLGKTGKNLSFILDGRRMLLRGEPAVPAILMINGEEAPLPPLSTRGPHHIYPARSGEDAAKTLGQLLGEDFSGRVLVNNQEASLDTALRQGDVILTLERGAAPEHPKAAAPAASVQTAYPGGAVSEPAAPAAVSPNRWSVQKECILF